MGFYSNPAVAGTAGQSVLTPSAQTASFTAVANYLYTVSASGGAVTVTLPASTASQAIIVKKTDSSANAVTLSGTINGTASTTFVISRQNQSKQLYADGSGGWTVTTGDLDPATIGYPSSIASLSQTANYTLVLADAGRVVEMNVPGINTVTIPPNSSVAYPVGAIVDVVQIGLGQTTLVAGTGVTLDAQLGTAIRAQYGMVRLRQRVVNEWVITGAVSQSIDPTTITGLVMRMRASTLGISTDGTSIANAPFELGGVTLTASGSAQPVWRARGVNGRPYIAFDGIDDVLSTTSNVPVYNQPVTICIVAQIRNGVTSQEAFKMGGIEMLLNQSSNTWSTYAGSLVNSNVTYGGVMCFTGVFGAGGNQGSIEGYTNGVFTASGGGGGNSTSGGDIYIGTHPQTPRFLSADYYEVLVYNQTMAAADLTKLHNYVQATYQFS